MSNSSSPTPVDFWLDPVCPWTWLTSRWMLEVRKTRPVAINWHVMSLAILNEARLDELPERIRDLMGQAWAPVRVLIAAQASYGPDVLEPLYTALGTRYHPRQEPKTRATIEAALREVGLPPAIADAGDTAAYDQALRESHQEGITLVGSEVGSPIIAVPGPAGSRQGRVLRPCRHPCPRRRRGGPPVGRHPRCCRHARLLRNQANTRRRPHLRPGRRVDRVTNHPLDHQQRQAWAAGIGHLPSVGGQRCQRRPALRAWAAASAGVPVNGSPCPGSSRPALMVSSVAREARAARLSWVNARETTVGPWWPVMPS